MRKKLEMPEFIKPQLATLKAKAPKGAYLHEIKYDGYRVQIHTGKQRHAFTRNGHDWLKRFSRIVGAQVVGLLAALPPRSLQGP